MGGPGFGMRKGGMLFGRWLFRVILGRFGFPRRFLGRLCGFFGGGLGVGRWFLGLVGVLCGVGVLLDELELELDDG